MIPISIAGGPVPHPIAKLNHVFRIPWYCDRSVDAEVILEYPDGVTPEPWPDLDEAFEVIDGLQRHIRFPEDHDCFDIVTELIHMVELEGLPDGCRVELLCHANGPDYSGGNHRYGGVVEGGMWSIDAAFPPVRADALNQALQLALESDRCEGFHMTDPAEARIVDSCASKEFLIQVQGDRLMIVADEDNRFDPDLLGYLVLGLRVFCSRFADVWDTAAALRSAPKDCGGCCTTTDS